MAFARALSFSQIFVLVLSPLLFIVAAANNNNQQHVTSAGNMAVIIVSLLIAVLPGSCSHGIFPVVFDRGFWYSKRRRFEGTSLRNDVFTGNFGSDVTCGDFEKMRGVSRWISQSKTRSATCPNFLKDKKK